MIWLFNNKKTCVWRALAVNSSVLIISVEDLSIKLDSNRVRKRIGTIYMEYNSIYSL